MSDFYVDTLHQLLDQGVLRRDSKMLVTCSGDYDKSVLSQCGFSDVTLSNLDTRMTTVELAAPYRWSFQDAENLTFDDGRFDFAVAHSGLHHCRSPHKALLEMYRVSRRGVIVFEPCDNLVTRLGVRLGLGQEYEVAAVAGAGCAYGGQRNTPIPNYVYRWTEREIEKTIYSYAPLGRHQFRYFYRLRVPWYRSHMLSSRALDWVFRLFTPLGNLITAVYPRAANNFAFVVLKPSLPDGLHPWLADHDGVVELNTDWVMDHYSRAPAETCS
jgi:ubiquinone/menaquinone biosynthesis C-methylase UbiE